MVTDALPSFFLGCLLIFVGIQALTSRFLLSVITIGTIISSGAKNI